MHASAADRGRDPARRPLVLLADDLTMVRRPLRLLLERRGFDVIEAGDGEDVLALVRGSAAIDCVLLDLSMPVMDGFAVLEALAQREHAPPVVVHTSQHRADADAALALGAAAVVLKGKASHGELIERVAVAIQAASAPPLQVAPASPAGSGPSGRIRRPVKATVDDDTGGIDLEPTIDPERWLVELRAAAAASPR